VLDFATKVFCIFSRTGVTAWAIIVKSYSHFPGFVLNSKVTYTEAVRHTQCRSCLFRALSVSQLCSREPEPPAVKNKSVVVTRWFIMHYFETLCWVRASHPKGCICFINDFRAA
jgi:hypothetical protein